MATIIMLTENQSTYIPLGQTHRLANPGKVPLEIIEVQSGSYLGEDDIVRFEDTYGRAPPKRLSGRRQRPGRAGAAAVTGHRRRRLHRQQLRAGLAGRQRDEPIVNLDALTYAGNLRNLAALQGDARHRFVHGDITDRACSTACLPNTARAPWCTLRPRATWTAASTAPAPS
jgi:hypothetical protein